MTGREWVQGEVASLKLASSGHAYFVLKDANAQMQAVLFRGQAGIDRSLLRDGAKVLLGGEMTVYEPRGQYQLRVTAVEVQGIGALQAAITAKLRAVGVDERREVLDAAAEAARGQAVEAVDAV